MKKIGFILARLSTSRNCPPWLSIPLSPLDEESGDHGKRGSSRDFRFVNPHTYFFIGTWPNDAAKPSTSGSRAETPQRPSIRNGVA